ncbi:dnaA [Caudoviricetes sp.]|nr:dnaA [Caudoviricetes sp.]
MYHALREAGFSLPQIGAFFGRDHTTILHGLRRWKEISGV